MTVQVSYQMSKAQVGVSQTSFREAMAMLGAAVNIVTTDGPAGRAGFAASAVCSVTDEPPTLLVCLNRSSSVYPAFEKNMRLCVNTLSADQEKLSSLFGGKTPVDERFAAAKWSSGSTGAPCLDNAIVSFDCTVERCENVGTHIVMFCPVIEIRHGAGSGALVYYKRRYHRIEH